MRNQNLVVERRVREDSALGWTDLPTRVMSAQRPVLAVPFEAPPTAERRVEFHRMPRDFSRVSEGFTIESGAVLQGGFALLTRGLEGDGQGAVFRVRARHGSAATVLLERTLDPTTTADRWNDFTIDLAPIVGQDVRFEISASRVGDGTSASAAGYPIFSLPRLLAPDRESRPLRGAILLSLDTLRADHVGTYGAGRADTPNLDRFAAESMVFETAVATSPTTTASHMSMLTGLYPLVHSVYGPRVVLSTEIPTLAQTLSAQGWTTAAITENGMIHPRSGFARGFDYYREFRGGGLRTTTGHVREVVDSGLAWVEEHRDERFFVFLHTYEVHGPYEPPPEFDRYRATDAESELDRDRRAYAGEVVYTDHEVGRLFDGLSKLGLLDDVAILVTANHGEGFGEHSFGHGLSLHEEAIRVPMLLRAPGRVEAGRRSQPVSLVDVTPTFLDLLGIAPASPMQGRSLVALAGDSANSGFAERAVFAERAKGAELAVHRRDHKWILSHEKPVRSGAYDLLADPRERERLTSPDALADGEDWVDRHRAASNDLRNQLRGAGALQTEVDTETIEELRALGYVD